MILLLLGQYRFRTGSYSSISNPTIEGLNTNTIMISSKKSKQKNFCFSQKKTIFALKCVVMERFLTYLIILLACINTKAQEYAGMTSGNLENEIVRPLFRNAARSTAIDKYEDRRADAPKDAKVITTRINNKTKNTTILSKGYIISETEDSPTEKSISTYLLDAEGHLERLSKRITNYNSKGEITNEYSDIATFFISKDTIIETHNYRENYHNYTYVRDDKENIIKKLYASEKEKDTTSFTYNEDGKLTSEKIHSTGIEITFEYDAEGNLTSEKKFSIGKNQKKTIRKETIFSYENGKLYSKKEISGADTTSLTFDRDSKGRIIKITLQENNLSSESTIEYNDKDLIIKDGRGYIYKYKYDKKGNWTHCTVSKKGKNLSISRDITYDEMTMMK